MITRYKSTRRRFDISLLWCYILGKETSIEALQKRIIFSEETIKEITHKKERYIEVIN